MQLNRVVATYAFTVLPDNNNGITYTLALGAMLLVTL